MIAVQTLLGALRLDGAHLWIDDNRLCYQAPKGVMTQARLAEILSRSTEYATTGGPFPDRLPIVAITGKLLMAQYESVVRWALWADDAIGGWSGVTPETGATVPPHAFTSGWADR